MNPGGRNRRFAYFSRLSLIALIVAVATLVGCATSSRTPSSSGPSCCKSGDAPARRAAIVRTAAGLVGATTVHSNGVRISNDCAGVVRAVFLEQGIDLYDSAADTNANGVKLIHRHVSRNGKLHQGPVVKPGDLVFFDNTWDSNGDGIMNDPLTHVGIVERQEPDGTVVFISRVAGAVERYHMNLGLPHVHRTAEGKLLNDYLRRKDRLDPLDTAYLTGELFAGFGTRAGF